MTKEPDMHIHKENCPQSDTPYQFATCQCLLTKDPESMKNIKSVLEGFDEKFCEEYGWSQNRIGGIREDLKSFLTSSLISLLEEVVPEEDMRPFASQRQRGEVDGYNKCRKQLLDNIATITKL